MSEIRQPLKSELPVTWVHPNSKRLAHTLGVNSIALWNILLSFLLRFVVHTVGHPVKFDRIFNRAIGFTPSFICWRLSANVLGPEIYRIWANTTTRLGTCNVKRHLRACFFTRVDNAKADRYRKIRHFYARMSGARSSGTAFLCRPLPLGQTWRLWVYGTHQAETFITTSFHLAKYSNMYSEMNCL